MIKIIKEAQVRSEEDNRNLRETVAGIIGEVRGRGDAALREYNEKFDGCTRESLRVSREEIDAAYKELGAPIRTPRCTFSSRCVSTNRCQFLLKISSLQSVSNTSPLPGSPGSRSRCTSA